MPDWIQSFYRWYINIGNQYGVNPFIFGVIYVSAIPFFVISIGWIVRNYKKRKPIILPVLSTTFFFLSSYIYLIFDGENIPSWIYGIVLIWAGYGAFVAVQKIRSRIHEHKQHEDSE